jgi:hypothetical protein
LRKSVDEEEEEEEEEDLDKISQRVVARETKNEESEEEEGLDMKRGKIANVPIYWRAEMRIK